MPLLLRDLIWASATTLSHIGIPGGDSVYRPGFDGIVISDEETPFVPAGRSVWEIGTDQSPKAKANSDFEKRKETSDQETTFVFVTPRIFSDKEAWAKEKEAEPSWRDVRVIDADDLEDWLSRTPSVAALWMERIANIPYPEITPLLQHWDEWKNAMQGYLSPELVLAGKDRQTCRYQLWDWLENDESQPLLLNAYSPHDGKLFLSASLLSADGYGDWLVRAVFCDDIKTLRQLAVGAVPQFIITNIDDRGIAQKAIKNGHKYCVLRPHSHKRKIKNIPQIELPLRISRHEGEQALRDLGMPKGEIERTLRSAGRMLMALRREISGEHPCWASPELRNIMPAVVLISGWDESRDEDRETLENLSRKQYQEIENALKKVKALPESPIQYIEPYWRVFSPMDTWRCLAPQLSKSDMENFRTVCIAAFTKPDPVLDLPSEQQWAAAIYNKRTPYSTFLREGLLQSLIIIAEFGDSFGLECVDSPQAWVNRVVYDIFEECRDSKKWKALTNSFIELAEAAPDIFLKELERRIQEQPESLKDLFSTEGDSLLSSGYYENLIWALKKLAWLHEYFPRVVRNLVWLCQIPFESNSNLTPLSALHDIFRIECPQTSVQIIKRQELLTSISDESPNTFVSLLLRLLPEFNTFFTLSPRPTWRETHIHPDVTQGEYSDGIAWAADNLVQSCALDGALWGQIINRYTSVPQHTQKIILDHLTQIIQAGKLEKDALVLRSAIRKRLHYWNLNKKSDIYPNEDVESFHKLCDMLEPDDAIEKALWLFDNTWPDLPDEDGSPDQKEKTLAKMRSDALKEIVKSKGVAGINKLAQRCINPWFVGKCAASGLHKDELSDFLSSLNIADDYTIPFCEGFIHGAGQLLGVDWINQLIENEQKTQNRPVVLAFCFLQCPPEKILWERIAELGEECDEKYWANFNFYSNREELNKLVSEDQCYMYDKLAKFSQVDDFVRLAGRKSSGMTYRQRIQALELYAKRHKNCRVDEYHIETIFKRIYECEDRDENEVTQFEFLYAELLKDKQLLLHKKMALHPEIFQSVFFSAYGEGDYNNKNIASCAYRVLESWSILPGVQPDGSVNENSLTKWIHSVRALCKGLNASSRVEQQIGEVLAHSPSDEDGLFPCEAVRNTMQNVLTEPMEKGFYTGVRNQEALKFLPVDEIEQNAKIKAQQFYRWAEQCRIRWPRVSQLLTNIADSYEAQKRRMQKDRLHDDMNY